MPAVNTLETLTLNVEDIHPHYKNPRRGDVDAIAESLTRNGQYRAIVVNKGTHTGRPMEVLAGNHTLLAARTLYRAGRITRTQAESAVRPYIDAANATSRRLAAKYGMRPRLMSVSAYLR